jgi:MoxR-like ATPase
MLIEPKFVGPRALIERCVVTLAGERGLLLVGQPGTAKSMLGKLLAAAISGTGATVKRVLLDGNDQPEKFVPLVDDRHDHNAEVDVG